MENPNRTITVVRILKNIVPSVERLRITVLVEDSTSMEKPDLVAKHGLSLLVETKADVNSKILMDTGPLPDIALQNVDIVDADLQEVDAIVISHGHYDHAGGLLKVLKRIRRPTPVVAHPKIFYPKFVLKPNLRFIGLDFDQQSVGDAGGVLVLARNPVNIANGVITSGEIARETTFEKPEQFMTVEDERFIEDPILDDQALFVNIRDRGLLVITGCAHAGIINTVRHAQKITGVKAIHAIIGGFHLAKADDKRIQASIQELEKIKPQSIYPCHCTGSETIHRLLDSFGDRCKPIHTGDAFEL